MILGNIAKDNGGHLYCVDPWKLPQREGTFDWAIASKGLEGHIHKNKMTSEKYYEELDDLAEEGKAKELFDFIYIDGDHTYDVAKIDFEAALRLIAPGGTIAIHDCVEIPGLFPKNWLHNHKNSGRIDIKTLFMESSPGFVHAGVNLLVEEYFGKIKERNKELVWF